MLNKLNKCKWKSEILEYLSNKNKIKLEILNPKYVPCILNYIQEITPINKKMFLYPSGSLILNSIQN
jgi:hypothetical protein